MNFKNLFNKSFGPGLRAALIVLGIALFLFGLTGSQSVLAAMAVTIDWGDISPDINPNPDFAQNTNIPVEINTFFAPGGSPHLNPYHGLGSAAGGLSGFSSQTFTNVSGSGVDVTVYYSDNNWDGNVLEGPDLYLPVTNINPDQRVTGEYALRETRDPVGVRTPTTVVLSFSEPVYMNELIVGSLSQVGSSYEHAIIRAFATADATGAVVKASGFINISDLDDCSTLLLTQCAPTNAVPTTTNLLSNVAVDPNLIDAGNDGTYDNVGTGADDGLYHVYGVIPQPNGYGRVKVVYESELIRSIAVSFFPTATASFTDATYTNEWISTILAPYTITPEDDDPTVITLNQASTSEPNSTLLLVGLALIIVATITGLAFRPRRQSVEIEQ